MNNTNVGVLTTGGKIDVSSQTLEQCLKGEYRFTETIYHNICNGTVSSVPAGFWDYAIGFGVILMAVFFGSLLLRMMFD